MADTKSLTLSVYMPLFYAHVWAGDKAQRIPNSVPMVWTRPQIPGAVETKIY